MKAIVVAALLLTGCGTTTITARDSLTPVMLGPVHYVGPDQGKLSHGIERRTYNAEYGAEAGRTSDNFVSNLDMTIPNGLALALADTPADFMLTVRHPIDCRLVHIFGLVVNIVTSNCHLETVQLNPKVPTE